MNRTRKWAALAGALAPCAVCQAGPNLVAIGNYGEVPYQRAEGHDSFSGGEVIFSFDDPDFDFGRIVVRSSSPNSVVRRDLLVNYSGRALVVDTRGAGGTAGGVSIDELEIWLKLKGKIRSGRRYEWEFEGSGASEISDGFPAILPVLWADGEQIGIEVNIHKPGEGPDKEDKEEEEEDRIRRLLFPHGIVTVKEFERQTGAAWLVLKPEDFGAYFALQRFSFREIDEDPATTVNSSMPIPIRYIPIRPAVEDEIAEALERASATLKRSQNPDHYWPADDLEASVSVTASVVSALAELDPTADGLHEAMEWLAEQKPEEEQVWSVPTVAMRLYCLARHGGLEDFRQAIYADVQFLTEGQLPDGGWTRRARRAGRPVAAIVHSDNEHSFLALLALIEARFAGVDVDRRMSRRATLYWIDAQAFDGGFREKLEKYGGMGQATTSAYTAVGATSLLASLDLAAGIGSLGCSKYLANRKLLRAVDGAFAWLDRNYQERFKDRGSLAGDADPYAQAARMQDLGRVSGLSHFNGKNHFVKSAELLLSGYDAASGMFGVRGQGGWTEAPSFNRTAQALSILGAGAAPTVCQRIVLGDDEHRWTEHNGDVRHLVRFLTVRRGRQFNWRRTSTEREVRELVEVPILFINVVGPGTWAEKEWNNIRAYCFAGGSVVINIAENARSQRAAVVSALRKTFPEYELAAMAKDDPLFSAETEIDDPPSIEAIGNGFRKFLFLPAQSWSCFWQLYAVADHEDSFAFVNNLLTYTTDGTPPRSSFALSTYAIGSATAIKMRATHLEVGGAVEAYPNLVDAMGRLMESNFRLKVTETQDAKDADILWVSVTGQAAPSQKAKTQMLDAIQNGRYLLVDIVSGNKDWDEGFQAVLRGLAPGITVEKLRRNDPIYTGELPGTRGFDVVTVRLRKALHTRFSKRGRCDLYKIRWNSKPVGVYSAYDISSGIGYNYFPDCRGVAPKHARQIAMNAFLTAYDRKVSGQRER